MLFSKAQASKTAGDTAFMILFAVCFCHLLNDTMQSMLPAIYPPVSYTHLTLPTIA